MDTPGVQQDVPKQQLQVVSIPQPRCGMLHPGLPTAVTASRPGWDVVPGLPWGMWGHQALCQQPELPSQPGALGAAAAGELWTVMDIGSLGGEQGVGSGCSPGEQRQQVGKQELQPQTPLCLPLQGLGLHRAP